MICCPLLLQTLPIDPLLPPLFSPPLPAAVDCAFSLVKMVLTVQFVSFACGECESLPSVPLNLQSILLGS